MKFLDKTGLQYFWGKMQTYVLNQLEAMPLAGKFNNGLMYAGDKQLIDKYKSMWQDMYGSGKDGNMPLKSVNISQSDGKLVIQSGSQDYSTSTSNIKETKNIPTATTSADGAMSSSDKQTLDDLNSKLQNAYFSQYFKEGSTYTSYDKSVFLDLKNLKDVKIYANSKGERKAAVFGHFRSDDPKGKFSVIYQDFTSDEPYPLVIETIPFSGILLGRAVESFIDNYKEGSGIYSTYIGRGVISVGDAQFITGLKGGKRVQLTSKGYRPVDKQGSVIIDDTWAKNNMNNIAICDATMIDAKVIDIDYDHKIATVRITIQDTKGKYFYVKNGQAVMGGTISSAVNGEYYANVVLQVPYDSSGNVSLYDKYAISKVNLLIRPT